MSFSSEPSPFSALQTFGLSQSSFCSDVLLEVGFPVAPGFFEFHQTVQAADSAGSESEGFSASSDSRSRSRSASPNPVHPSGGSSTQLCAVSFTPSNSAPVFAPTYAPVSAPTYAPVSVEWNKLRAADQVLPIAFQLDGRINSGQVTGWTCDYIDVFYGIPPVISKLFALLQFNSRTSTTSTRTPRWYLRGNQWLVGFNKKLFTLPENQQMFGIHYDSVYQMLTGRSKGNKEPAKPYLVHLCNYFKYSNIPEVEQLGCDTMAFYWRQDFFPNCSLFHLRNVSIPIQHEVSCIVSMGPTMLHLDTPDWNKCVNCYEKPAPLVAQPQADDEGQG